MNRSEYSKTIRLARLAVEENLMDKSELMAYKSAGRLNAVSRPKAAGLNCNQLCDLEKKISSCVKCRLGKTRIKFVFGEGNPEAELMFVGEGPGYDEDHQGRPFIGRAGQLLTKIIESTGFKREEVFIANLVKCHPMKEPSDPEKRGNDRPPAPDEIQECLPYLEKQISIIHPRIICALGSYSAKTLLATEEGISTLRGHFTLRNGILVMPTYHPAALLRNPAWKKEVWHDMKMIIAELGRSGKKN
jgi:DNA polymerase